MAAVTAFFVKCGCVRAILAEGLSCRFFCRHCVCVLWEPRPMGKQSFSLRIAAPFPSATQAGLCLTSCSSPWVWQRPMLGLSVWHATCRMVREGSTGGTAVTGFGPAVFRPRISGAQNLKRPKSKTKNHVQTLGRGKKRISFRHRRWRL